MPLKRNPKPPKKKKPVYIDDGHTVYDMSGLHPDGGKADDKDDAGLNRREKHAAIRAAFAVYLPRMLMLILCFLAAMGLIYLWLH